MQMLGWIGSILGLSPEMHGLWIGRVFICTPRMPKLKLAQLFSCSCFTGDCTSGSVCRTHAAAINGEDAPSLHMLLNLVLQQSSFVLGVLLVYAPIPCIDASVACMADRDGAFKLELVLGLCQ